MDDITVLAKLKVEELKVQADINYQLEVNKLEDLKSVDEVVDPLDRLFVFSRIMELLVLISSSRSVGYFGFDLSPWSVCYGSDFLASFFLI